MIALDTNIVVRLIVNDDAEQVKRARSLIRANSVLLPTTVVLEAEWVLRSAYGFASREVHRALKLFCGIKQVTLAEPEVVRAALTYHAQGLDFADALHIAGSGTSNRFATFDRTLRKRTTSIEGMVEIMEP